MLFLTDEYNITSNRKHNVINRLEATSYLSVKRNITFID
jgi:hypothetical protein